MPPPTSRPRKLATGSDEARGRADRCRSLSPRSDWSSIGDAEDQRGRWGRGSMGQSNFARFATVALVVGGLIGGTLTPANGQILIVGNDEKQAWDETGKAILRQPGKAT